MDNAEQAALAKASLKSAHVNRVIAFYWSENGWTSGDGENIPEIFFLEFAMVSDFRSWVNSPFSLLHDQSSPFSHYHLPGSFSQGGRVVKKSKLDHKQINPRSKTPNPEKTLRFFEVHHWQWISAEI